MKVVWEGVAVLCTSGDGQSLLMVLQGRADETPSWAVPGRSIWTGESPAEAAVREAQEETGLDVRILRRYTTVEGAKAYGPYRVHYFEGEVLGGELRVGDPDGLIHRVIWVPAGALSSLRLTHEDQRDILASFLSSASSFDPGDTSVRGQKHDTTNG